MGIIATKLKMDMGKDKSLLTTEIKEIYLEGLSEDGFYSKESIHAFLIKNPNTEIVVNISPYPKLIPATHNNQKYVRSSPNDTPEDNLLKLPRI